VAITSHLFILAITVESLQAPEGDLGRDELVLGGRFFWIKDENIHISEGDSSMGTTLWGEGVQLTGPDWDDQHLIYTYCWPYLDSDLV
jgi:hypothetical protein